MTNKFQWIKPDNFLPPEYQEVFIELKNPIQYPGAFNWRYDVAILLYIYCDITGHPTWGGFQTRTDSIDIGDVLWWSYIPVGEE